MINKYLSAVSISTMILFSACGGDNTSTTNNTQNLTTIIAVDGYIKNANIIDNSGQRATYTSNGKYTFVNAPVYPITLSGGKLEDSNISFDINMSVNDGTSLVISPISTFLENNSSLLSKFASLGFGKSTLDEFNVDYIDTNDSNLSKLSQLLYSILKDDNLTADFKISLDNNSSIDSLDKLFTLASNQISSSNTLSLIDKLRTNSFLNSIKDYNGTSANIEDDNKTKAYKYNLVNSNKTTMTHNGTSYGTVMSPYTGKIWLDRNLGANKVCDENRDNGIFSDTSYTTSQKECFGDYYQWGRNYDGHQESNSSTTSTRATDINATVADGSFIKDGSTYYDWVDTTIDDNGSIRNSNWSKIDGSSVCPIGFRVANKTELIAETTGLSVVDGKVTNRSSIFYNFLKFPSAGIRSNVSNTMYGIASSCDVWTSSVYGSSSIYFTFSSSNASSGLEFRVKGLSVRCIKN